MESCGKPLVRACEYHDYIYDIMLDYLEDRDVDPSTPYPTYMGPKKWLCSRGSCVYCNKTPIKNEWWCKEHKLRDTMQSSIPRELKPDDVDV